MTVNSGSVLSLDAAKQELARGKCVELCPSVSMPTHHLVVVNTTASVIVLACGPEGQEKDLVAIGPKSQLPHNVGMNVMPVGVRLSLRALDQSATSGHVVVSLQP